MPKKRKKGCVPDHGMRMTVSGPPGSGKTTVATQLASAIGLKAFSAGDLFRGLAEENDLTLEELGSIAEQNWDIDRELDSRMVQVIRENEAGIFEGRLTGYLTYMHDIPSFKVYITAPFAVRVRRIMRRENKDRSTVERELATRERSEQKRYKHIYGFDIDDISIYDLKIDSSKKSPQRITEEICRRMK